MHVAVSGPGMLEMRAGMRGRMVAALPMHPRESFRGRTVAEANMLVTECIADKRQTSACGSCKLHIALLRVCMCTVRRVYTRLAVGLVMFSSL